MTDVLTQGTEQWFSAREMMAITASEFSTACDRNYFKSSGQMLEEKVKKFRWGGNDATRYGQRNEPNAVKQFERDFSLEVIPTGLHVHSEFKNIGGSPDGLIDIDDVKGLIEVKCPFKYSKTERVVHHRMCPRQYRDQIQGLLEITDRAFCYLIVWSPNDVCYVRVERDRDFWRTQMFPKIMSFVGDLEERRLQDEVSFSSDVTCFASEFEVICGRSPFKSRKCLIGEKIRKAKKKAKKRKSLPTKEKKKNKKQTRLSTSSKTGITFVSAPFPVLPLKRPPKLCFKDLDPRLWAGGLPAEVMATIYRLHHELLWSSVMRQLCRCIRVPDRPHDKRPYKRRYSKLDSVRSQNSLYWFKYL